MELSKRLEAIATCVNGPSLADIGTDHAYLPIALCQRGIIQKAIASDINNGPLQRAHENIAAQGLSAQIETRLGAGLSTIAPCDASCCVIAGMGGLLVLEILANDMPTAKSFQTLVLQPQRDLPEVRRFLLANGFVIQDEAMLVDGGKFYNILTCIPRIEQEAYTDTELFFGRHLLRKRDKTLADWLAREITRVDTILTNMRRTASDAARLHELETWCIQCEEGLRWLQCGR